jgi:hypothetical protein
MQLQSVITFACYDSPSITGAGVSMTEAAMEQLMTKKLCFGNGNDEETIHYVEQFLYGLNRFQGLFVSSALPSSSATVDKTVLGKVQPAPILNCQFHRCSINRAKCIFLWGRDQLRKSIFAGRRQLMRLLFLEGCC